MCTCVIVKLIKDKKTEKSELAFKFLTDHLDVNAVF